MDRIRPWVRNNESCCFNRHHWWISENCHPFHPFGKGIEPNIANSNSNNNNKQISRNLPMTCRRRMPSYHNQLQHSSNLQRNPRTRQSWIVVQIWIGRGMVVSITTLPSPQGGLLHRRLLHPHSVSRRPNRVVERSKGSGFPLVNVTTGS